MRREARRSCNDRVYKFLLSAATLRRCNFLGKEVSLLMQLLEDADIPDPCAGEICYGAAGYAKLVGLLMSLCTCRLFA